jgi:hypothetical protein
VCYAIIRGEARWLEEDSQVEARTIRKDATLGPRYFHPPLASELDVHLQADTNVSGSFPISMDLLRMYLHWLGATPLDFRRAFGADGSTWHRFVA